MKVLNRSSPHGLMTWGNRYFGFSAQGPRGRPAGGRGGGKFRELETAELIVREKHFRNSNCYVVATSAPNRVTAIEVVIQIESPQSAGCQSPQSAGCQSPQSAGCKGNPEKGIHRRVINSSSEGIQFADWFKASLPETINLKANWQESFAKAYDDLVRIDKRSMEGIKEVCRWARMDKFWKTNFMSPSKLRDRNKDGIIWFDVFVEKARAAKGKPKFKGNGQDQDQSFWGDEPESESEPKQRPNFDNSDWNAIGNFDGDLDENIPLI